MTPQLTVDCRKRLASGFIIDARLSVALDPPGVLVLFGPSGAGKTTLLRLIAGLDRPDEGSIVFSGKDWTRLTPQQRRAGFVFQDYALFPHLTVAENVFFGACTRRRELLKNLGLDHLATRMPRTLSGGEQQRVALARALAADPTLLLLDEPLSALDAASRVRLRAGLRRDLRAAQLPAIVVTHDRTEAMALGDCIAVMIAGRICQSGAVSDVFRRPADAEVAAAVGVENVLPARIGSREAGLLTLQLGDGTLLQCVDTEAAGPQFACIRAEDIAITREETSTSSARNRLTGNVTAVTLEGALARVELDCGVPLVSLITAQSVSDMRLAVGDWVSAIVKATSVHLLPQ